MGARCGDRDEERGICQVNDTDLLLRALDERCTRDHERSREGSDRERREEVLVENE